MQINFMTFGSVVFIVRLGNLSQCYAFKYNEMQELFQGLPFTCNFIYHEIFVALYRNILNIC